jgi:hypothetical protein
LAPSDGYHDDLDITKTAKFSLGWRCSAVNKSASFLVSAFLAWMFLLFDYFSLMTDISAAA